MPAPRLTAKIGRKTKRGTTVNASHVIGSVNDYYYVTLVVQENNARVISEAIGDALTAALEEIGQVAEGAAKRLCPVDTGRLRNSITHALSGEDSVTIGTNVEYAIYVHEGTSRRDGTPFLRDAAQRNKGRFESILRKHMQNG